MITFREAQENRRTAEEAGVRFYDGKACKKCQSPIRYVNTGGCRDCTRKQGVDRYHATKPPSSVPRFDPEAHEASKTRRANGSGRRPGQRRAHSVRVRPIGYAAPTFEGKPCPRGHTTRYVAHGTCAVCAKEKWHGNGPAKGMLASARRRAKELGLGFDLEESDIVVPTHCPALGLELKVARGFRTDNSPSLDRIDNTKGYVKGNVAVISLRANRLKSNAVAEDLEAVAAWIRSVLPA